MGKENRPHRKELAEIRIDKEAMTQTAEKNLWAQQGPRIGSPTGPLTAKPGVGKSNGWAPEDGLGGCRCREHPEDGEAGGQSPTETFPLGPERPGPATTTPTYAVQIYCSFAGETVQCVSPSACSSLSVPPTGAQGRGMRRPIAFSCRAVRAGARMVREQRT